LWREKEHTRSVASDQAESRISERGDAALGNRRPAACYPQPIRCISAPRNVVLCGMGSLYARDRERAEQKSERRWQPRNFHHAKQRLSNCACEVSRTTLSLSGWA